MWLKISALLLMVNIISAAKILAYFSMPSRSHQNVHDPVILELVKRGHQVVVVTSFPFENPPQNLTQIDISFSIAEFRKRISFNKHGDQRPVYFYKHYLDHFLEVMKMQLETPGVQDIINGKNDYDLIIMNCYNVLFGFKHKFPGVPIVGITSLPFYHDEIGSSSHPLFYPDFLSYKNSGYSFMDKIYALYDYLYIRYVYQNDCLKNQKLARQYFGRDLPSICELRLEVDLVLTSASPLLTQVRPEVPAAIHIEGIHLKPKKILPNDLKSFLDNSSEGVIYMSLGSNVLSKDLGNETLEAITNAFAMLPYKVLWKFETDNFPGLPENVITRKWLPQQDILGLKNIKGFIFQGGLQSWEEAIYNEVPLVVLPVTSDQFKNADKIKQLGIGLSLDLKKLTPNQLYDAVMNITMDSKYKEKVKELHKLSFDQPMSPMERAMWWIEYVIRHKGAKHLRSPAAGVSMYEYFMVDVVIVVLGLVLSLIVSISLFVSYVKKIVLAYIISSTRKLKKI